MKKHTLPAFLVALAIIIVGFWGSMQDVSASDTISVQLVGTSGKTVATTKNTNTKSSTKKATTVASNASTDKSSSSIVIEVVPDNSDSKSSSKTSTDTSSKKGSVAGIAYDKLVMANVEEAVNIRDSASESGKLVGKFFKECAGTILEKSNGWTKIKTGDVTGWVKNDFLLFGDDAVKLAEKVVEKTATCNTDCLRVRKSADANGTVLDLLAEGDQIGVLSEEGEWVKVEYSDGEIGYVSSEFVTVGDNLGTGRSIEDINAELAAQKKAAEEAAAAAKKENSSKEDKSSSKSSDSVQAPAATQTEVPSAAGFSDVVLLAALIQAESGTQPYEGQVAVGNVVMNRLATGRYGSSIYSVIFAKSQFGPAGSGQVARIAAAGPKASCLSAAQDAMNGVNYIGTATHFRNVNSGNTGIVIGAHVFW